MAAKAQMCSRWECPKNGHQGDPLCKRHWNDWDTWEIEECTRCHWFYSDDEAQLFRVGGLGNEYPFMCDACMLLSIQSEEGRMAALNSQIKRNLMSRSKELEAAEILTSAEIKEAESTIWKLWQNYAPVDRPKSEHRPLKRSIRYVYVLKLSDGEYYVGQTNDLSRRLIDEHQQGEQWQTEGKNPKLVYFESFEGDHDQVDDRESELEGWSTSILGTADLVELIDEFRSNMDLVDFTA